MPDIVSDIEVLVTQRATEVEVDRDVEVEEGVVLENQAEISAMAWLM